MSSIPFRLLTLRRLIVLLVFLYATVSGLPEIEKQKNIAIAYKQQSLTQSSITTKKSMANKTEIINAQIRQMYIDEAKLQPTVIPTLPPEKNESPWGVSQQIDEHTWTIKVGQDEKMATPQEILAALNVYRQRYGKGTLAWDDKLAEFANTRAEYFTSVNKLDSHAGFLDYLDNQDGFKKLGFSSLGENSSIGYRLEGVHLIEWVYAGDKPHDDNQLNHQWQHVGIGVNGTATNLIFGGDRL